MPKKIVIPAMEDLWDEERNEFVTLKPQTLIVEHSLLSVSKWESKWKKPFLSSEKTYKELLDYIRCMTLNQVDDRVYDLLPISVIKEIDEYIGDPMTATTFNDVSKGSPRREIITSEIIYYQMISFGIPYEFEKRHLNWLISLIRVFSIKNGNTKKMSEAEAAAFQRAVNDRRLANAKSRR